MRLAVSAILNVLAAITQIQAVQAAFHLLGGPCLVCSDLLKEACLLAQLIAHAVHGAGHNELAQAQGAHTTVLLK